LNLEVLEARCVPALYTVTELGTLGGYYSSATDVNAAGQVVGSADTPDGYQHAALWDNGSIIDLGTLGGTYSWAEGINDLGQVVGSAYLPGDAAIHGFLVDPQAGVWFQDHDLDGRNDFMIDLGSLEGSDSSQASDINNAGQVVGASATADGFNHAFLWDPTNGLTDLGTPSGFTDSWATAINASGQVTGVTQFYDELSGWHTSALLWDAANGMIALGAGPGYTDSNAAGINDDGELVGYQWDAVTQVDPAFLWTPDAPNGVSGSFTDLGMLPYGIDSGATGVNNAGQVVGWSSVDDGWDYYTYAVLWDAADGIVNLQNQLLPGSGATVQGAQAIKDEGAIAVNGYNDWGEYRAFLLTPISGSIPFISIANAPSVTEGNTGARTASFDVTLSVASTQTVTVAYSTSNGAALAGSDYQFTNGTLTFEPGVLTQTLTVPVIGDRSAETDEGFFVNLSGPTNAFLANGQGTATIVDDEPRISITDVSRLEGRNGRTLFHFEVTLIVPGGSEGYDQAVTMSFATVNGTAKKGEDYTARTGTLTFAAFETTKSITIEVKGDTKKESNETFYLDLAGLSTNAKFTKQRGIGTILNDD
jgi:probable HAF family extracellular repeat protein